MGNTKGLLRAYLDESSRSQLCRHGSHATSDGLNAKPINMQGNSTVLAEQSEDTSIDIEFATSRKVKNTIIFLEIKDSHEAIAAEVTSLSSLVAPTTLSPGKHIVSFRLKTMPLRGGNLPQNLLVIESQLKHAYWRPSFAKLEIKSSHGLNGHQHTLVLTTCTI